MKSERPVGGSDSEGLCAPYFLPYGPKMKLVPTIDYSHV